MSCCAPSSTRAVHLHRIGPLERARPRDDSRRGGVARLQHETLGRLILGGRPFEFRRVAFPDESTAEWYVVDLFESAARAATSRANLTQHLFPAFMTPVGGGPSTNSLPPEVRIQV